MLLIGTSWNHSRCIKQEKLIILNCFCVFWWEHILCIVMNASYYGGKLWSFLQKEWAVGDLIPCGQSFESCAYLQKKNTKMMFVHISVVQVDVDNANGKQKILRSFQNILMNLCLMIKTQTWAWPFLCAVIKFIFMMNILSMGPKQWWIVWSKKM